MSALRDELAVVRDELRTMLGPGDYAIPMERFQPTEHERMILRRLAALADIVDRLAEKVDP